MRCRAFRRLRACSVVGAGLGLFSTNVVAQTNPPSSGPFLAVSAGIEGQLTTLQCGDTHGASAFEHVAAQFAAVPNALAVDAGGLLGAAAISRVAVSTNAGAFASAVQASGLRALMVGRTDLSAPRATLLTFAGALAVRNLPYVLSNLVCAREAADVCAVVHDASDPPLLFDTAAGRVALITAQHPGVLTTIAHDRSRGLSFRDPWAALAQGVMAARTAGADRVVAIYDPEKGDEVRDGLRLAGKFETTNAPDVLVINRAGDQFTIATGAGVGVPVVATRPRQVVTFPAPLPAANEPDVPETPPAAVTTFARATARRLCFDHDRVLAGGRLRRPLSLEEFAGVTLDVMREVTASEIAIVNRGAFGASWLFPIEGAITRLRVMAAMPFDNELRVTSLSGETLKKFALSPEASRFYLRGVTVKDDNVQINGRDLDETISYEVTTIDFVAEGGEGGVPTGKARWASFGSVALRDLLLRWLDRPVEGDDDLFARVQDPARRTRWTFRWTVDGAITSVNVSNNELAAPRNPPVLTDTQLTRAQNVTLRGETELSANADHPVYTLENSFRARLSTTNTTPYNQPSTGYVENFDLIVARTTGVYRQVRKQGPPRWYDPLPAVDIYTESEFTRPATRAFHHLLFRPTIGPRFELLPGRLFAYFGGGLDWETLATRAQYAPQKPGAFVFLHNWTLRPGKLFTIADRTLEAESSFDAVARDPLGVLGVLVRFRSKISFPVFEPLSFTIGYEMFARFVHDTQNSGRLPFDLLGIAQDINLGLRVKLSKSLQVFSY